MAEQLVVVCGETSGIKIRIPPACSLGGRTWSGWPPERSEHIVPASPVPVFCSASRRDATDARRATLRGHSPASPPTVAASRDARVVVIVSLHFLAGIPGYRWPITRSAAEISDKSVAALISRVWYLRLAVFSICCRVSCILLD